MLEFISYLIIAFLIGGFIGTLLKKDRYWTGRLEGWLACEGMALERAKALHNRPKGIYLIVLGLLIPHRVRRKVYPKRDTESKEVNRS
jgi:hypothetical protein